MRTQTFALGPILVLGAGLALAPPSLAAPGIEASAEPAEISGEAEAGPQSEPDARPSQHAPSSAMPEETAAPAPAAMPEAEASGAAEPGSMPAAGAAGMEPADAMPAAAQPDLAEAFSVSETDSEPVPEPEAAAGAPGLPGAVGYDEKGRQGWVHVVETGDTLWDISDGYLGTPWVWPSIWNENQDIENPHRIYPGDHIWITPHEMRRVSADEAADLLAGAPLDGMPGSLEEVEGDVPLEGGSPAPQAIRYPNIEAVGLLRVEEIDAAASIVDSTAPQVLLSSGATVFLGLGEGEAEVGDRYTVFRKAEQVRDPDTGRVLGHFVDVLGWVEVASVHPESVEAVIRVSYSEIHRGDPVIPRAPLPGEIELRPPLDTVEGRIAYLPHNRDLVGRDDFVYLNRGALHGLDVGNRLEVYRRLGTGRDRVRDAEVSLPDQVIADLLVVSAQPETAVAVVRETDTELELGDRFRTRLE